MSFFRRHFASTVIPVYLLLAGAAGLVFYLSFRDDVFRGASLSLKMGRPEAITRAEEFLSKRKYEVAGASRSAAFFSYETPSVYLEKNAGTEQTNEWLKEANLPVWGWEVRFFRPLEEDEYTVWWDPSGRLCGFEHQIPAERPMQSLSKDEAFKMASDFLQAEFPQEFSNFLPTTSSSERKPKRLDHEFKWRVKNSPLALRSLVSVVVSGNELTSVRREVEVPESFEDQENVTFEKRSFLSSVVGKIDTVLSLFLVYFLFLFWRSRKIRWKPAMILGAVLFGIQLLAFLNELPLRWHQYATTETIPAFWLSTTGYPLLFLMIGSLWAALQFASADAMGRFPPHTQYSLGETTSRSFFSSREFAQATFAGFCAAGVQLGFVVLYYIVGSRYLGFYSPMEVRYDDLLTTKLPWVSPLLVGLKPALSEESLYRLFAIPLVFRFLKRKWIAVLLSSLLWGFLHTSYYVEPIYARGLELTLVGVFLSLVYLKYGIWATIVCHYVYNSTLSSSLLMASGDTYLRFSSLLVIGLLGIPFLFSARRLLAGHAPPVKFEPFQWPQRLHSRQTEIDRRTRTEYSMLQKRWALGVLLLSAGVAFSFIPIQPPPVTMPPAQAAQISSQLLDRLGFPVEGYLISSSLDEAGTDEAAMRYAKGQLPKAEAEKYIDRFFPSAGRVIPEWTMKYSSRTEPTQCEVTLTQRGSLKSVYCSQADENAGASLEKDASRKRAEEFLTAEGLWKDGFEYSGVMEKERPRRKDIHHLWKDAEANVGEMERVVSVSVAGDRVAGYDVQFQPPEAFLRQEAKGTSIRVLRTFAIFLIVAVVLFLLLRAAFDRIVLSALPNRIPWIFAGLAAVFAVLHSVSSWPTLFWAGFAAPAPMEIYIGKKILNLLGQTAGAAVGAFLSVVLFLRLPPQIYPEAPTFEDMKIILKRPPWRWRETRVSFLWALALGAFTLAIRAALSGGRPEYAFGAFSKGLPLVDFTVDFWQEMIFWPAFAALLAASRKYLHRSATYALVLLGAFYLSGNFDRDSWKESLASLLSIAATVFLVLKVIRFRLPFYFWHAVISAATPFLFWVNSEIPSYRYPAQAVGAILLVFLLVTFLPLGRSVKSREGTISEA